MICGNEKVIIFLRIFTSGLIWVILWLYLFYSESLSCINTNTDWWEPLSTVLYFDCPHGQDHCDLCLYFLITSAPLSLIQQVHLSHVSIILDTVSKVIQCLPAKFVGEHICTAGSGFLAPLCWLMLLQLTLPSLEIQRFWDTLWLGHIFKGSKPAKIISDVLPGMFALTYQLLCQDYSY